MLHNLVDYGIIECVRTAKSRIMTQLRGINMDHIITEKDISTTVQDFDALCSYIMANKPTLTPSGALNTKACFDLNSIMTYTLPNTKKTAHMQTYQSISLYFTIAWESGLLFASPGSGQKFIVTVSDSYTAYQQMNKGSKYMFIFLAWMRYAHLEDWYGMKMLGHWLNHTLLDDTFEQIRKMRQPGIVHRKDRYPDYFSKEEPIQVLMRDCLILIHHLRDLGVLGYDDEDKKKLDVYRTVVNKLWITELGITLAAACSTRRISWINVLETEFFDYTDQDIAVFENDFKENLPGSEGFFRPFLLCFPENEVDTGSINQLLFPQIGITEDFTTDNHTVYEFKVSLRSCYSCYRIIQCRGSHTFEDLHLAIQNAFDFDNDHLYAFHLDGKRRAQNSINSPYSEEPPFADDICIAEAKVRISQKILYVFDYGDYWMFDVTLLSICESDTVLLRPVTTKSVGKAPEQYPSYDDDWDV